MFRCVPHSLMDCVSKRARAARSKLCKCQIAFKTNIRGHVSLCFDIRSIRQDRPPCKSFQNILYSPNWFFVPFCLETMVYSPLPFVFLFSLTQSSALSAETFSMYTSFSYGLLQKNAARAARKIFQYMPEYLRGHKRAKHRRTSRASQ